MRLNVEKKVLQLLQKTAEKEVRRLDVEAAESEWPPNCGCLIHQPKRPSNKNKLSTE